VNVLAFIGEFSYFAYQSFRYALGAFLRPGPFLHQLYVILLGALPLGLVAGGALGAVVWMHLHNALARTKTEEVLPTFLSVAVLLELAPISAGLIIAARTGASLSAEIGSMKQTEQIDALEMLGIPPMRQLVGPRVLACMFALPLLHIFISALALLSGYFAENLFSHTSWLRYQSLCLKELYPEDVIPAALKTIVFGYLVGVAGCFYGFRAEGGTEGVGQATTSGVVASALLVLAADVVLVAIIQVLR
jgi:phospholipid/cholesterol/gamma-HCH transport system permease protein